MLNYPIPLRYLILAGFFVSLIPLAFLLWQSTSTINSLSHSSVNHTLASANIVRNVESMKNQLTDIERAIRQYRVLQQADLAALAQKYIAQYSSNLQQTCRYLVLADDSLCSHQLSAIGEMLRSFTKLTNKQLNADFLSIRQQQQQLTKQLWQFLDDSIDAQKAYVEQRQQRITRLLVSLVLTTALMIYWLSGYLVQPVRQLENKIMHLGQQPCPALDSQRKQLFGARELQRIDQRLTWLSQRLNKLESLRQAFLRHAAHELKTPLSSIKEGCAILSEELAGPLNEQQQEVVELLDEGSCRLAYLTEALLDYDFLLQQPKPTLVALEPQSLIDESVAIYQLAFLKRKQTVTVDCQLAHFFSDKRLFMRILDNLLNNAQAYGNVGGQVLIQLQAHEAALELRVANTKSDPFGAPDQDLFEPFQRGNSRRSDAIKSTGLGLSIVQDCARLLDGQARFIQLPNFDFCISIVLAQPTAAEVA